MCVYIYMYIYIYVCIYIYQYNLMYGRTMQQYYVEPLVLEISTRTALWFGMVWQRVQRAIQVIWGYRYTDSTHSAL